MLCNVLIIKLLAREKDKKDNRYQIGNCVEGKEKLAQPNGSVRTENGFEKTEWGINDIKELAYKVRPKKYENLSIDEFVSLLEKNQYAKL